MHERIKRRREAVSLLQNSRPVLGELVQSATVSSGGFSCADFLRALRDLGTNEDDGAASVGSVGQDYGDDQMAVIREAIRIVAARK